MIFSFKWNTDTFFDNWSFVHILWGIIMGVASSFTSFSFPHAFAIALALIILWELIEGATNIIESGPGVLSDIIVGIAGFVLGYLLMTSSVLIEYRIHILVISVVTVIILEYLGWSAFMKREGKL